MSVNQCKFKIKRDKIIDEIKRKEIAQGIHRYFFANDSCSSALEKRQITVAPKIWPLGNENSCGKEPNSGGRGIPIMFRSQ